MAFWNKKNLFPYTNNHDENLDYMMGIFEKIKDEWNELYTELKAWKNTTTEELETWKNNVIGAINVWENQLMTSLNTWKTETQTDISEWETTILNDLNTWRNNFEVLFDETFDNLSQIKTDAEAARDRAETAAETAESAAEEISDSLEQITENTNDISDLKTQITYTTGLNAYSFQRGNYNLITVTLTNIPAGAKFHINNNTLLFRLKDGNTVVKDFSANDYTTIGDYSSLICDARNADSSFISDEIFGAARIYISVDNGTLSSRIKNLEDNVAQNTDDITNNTAKIDALNANLDNYFSLDSLASSAYQGGITNAGVGFDIANIRITDALNRIRTFNAVTDAKNILITANSDLTIECENGYKFAYQAYDAVSDLGTDTFAFSTSAVTLNKQNPFYLVVMLGKTDDSAISTDELTNLHIYYQNDLKETTIKNEKDIEDIQSEITVPFSFAITDKIYKKKNKYFADFKPQKYYNTSANGVTVFISENGDDTNNGRTVNTPKKTIESCLSVSNVSTIVFLPGTYTAGTHFTAGLTVSTAINFVGVGAVVIDNGTTDPIKFTNNVYCENITFKGGNNTVISQQSDATKRAVFYHCKFTESYRLNGLAIIGGLAYVVECEAYKNAYDGFNYHANSSVIANAIEVDCTAYNNGQYNLDGADGQSSNATTSHDDCPIVRLNGEYYACHGGIIADKDCDSANYGCTAGISTITDATNYPDRMSNYWSSGADMYLYDCISYGSKYDTAKIRSGQITSDTIYPSNYSA